MARWVLIVGLLAVPFPAHAQRGLEDVMPGDVALGLQISVMLEETIGLVDDADQLDRITGIGYQVASVTGNADIPYSFRILDLPEPNAMALPGGFIFITRGMMEIDLTNDELAHLLGHEISHVHLNHFNRASRLSTLFSVLQTALTVGILMSGAESGGTQYEVSEDPGLNEWSGGMTGKEALLQGTTILGSVARALFERGFSRKLEFEADESGSRFAVRAGYAPEGGVAMLQKLHQRSFEGNRFSYWRTHPYFDDRVARSTILSRRLAPAVTRPSDTAYRQKLALFFATSAARVPGSKEAVYLYRSALLSQPEHLASLPTALELVRFKRAREEQLHPLRRIYTPLITEYDSLIAAADREEAPWEGLEAARSERDELRTKREGLLSDYTTVLEGENPSTSFLERFIANYPEHPRRPEMTCVLGLHYQLSGKADEAVELMEEFLETEPEAPWADSARSVLRRAIREVEDPVLCMRLMESHADAARARMDQLVASDMSLEAAARFLESYPDTDWSDDLRDLVRRKARSLFEGGRVQEGLRRYQSALDAYFTILALAPNTPAASDAEAAIERIHRIED